MSTALEDKSSANQRDLARHFLYRVRSVRVDAENPMAAVAEMQRLAGPAFLTAALWQREHDCAACYDIPKELLA